MTRWLPADDGAVLLVHERTRNVIASSVELALTRRARRAGLLGRMRIDPAAAMVLAPCFAIHTAFMRFPIDVLFVDRHGRALRVVHGLAPWRAAAATSAHAVIELAAGVLTRHRVEIGDRLDLVPSIPNSQLPTPNDSRLGVGCWELGVDSVETRC